MHAAWVIEWDEVNDGGSSPRWPLYILPYRWSNDKVLDFMRAIHHNNTSLFFGFETLRRINKHAPEGLILVNEGRHITMGYHPYLVGAYVRDLVIRQDEESNLEILTWTRPAGMRRDRDTGRPVEAGSPIYREVRRRVGS